MKRRAIVAVSASSCTGSLMRSNGLNRPSIPSARDKGRCGQGEQRGAEDEHGKPEAEVNAPFEALDGDGGFDSRHRNGAPFDEPRVEDQRQNQNGHQWLEISRNHTGGQSACLCRNNKKTQCAGKQQTVGRQSQGDKPGRGRKDFSPGVETVHDRIARNESSQRDGFGEWEAHWLRPWWQPEAFGCGVLLLDSGRMSRTHLTRYKCTN